ncbi:MAG: SRPBCC family protein [SAR202 cluster bacterium]|jgi:uncharacterized protein YndB with AHSA1/START domain|nr:SRPBCC family protein [SAR202 cluster bacterium]MDP6512557.1 SRPBCC family protein [SAR202 cluster bacterium]
MKASATVTIEAPIEQVFDYIADIENMDQWVNGVTEPKWTSDPVEETGATFQSFYTYGGTTHEMEYEITALEAPTRMATRSTSGPFPFDAEVELVPVEEKTRITNTLDARATNLALGIWFALFGVLIRPFMARQLQRELLLVKTLLEEPEQVDES